MQHNTAHSPQRATGITPAPGRARLIHVVQGDHSISAAPGTIMTTVLGSCISTCMWDRTAGIGGMNHFLLPGEADVSDGQRYGVHAMEVLVNGLLRAGAQRNRLQAKVFGGARVVNVSFDIGKRNGEFVRRFLLDERIPLVAESIGGEQARRIRFDPTTGDAKQKLMDKTSTVDIPPPPPPVKVENDGDVELF